jgi:ligand-binding SRPBCC domain-containing protein
MIEIRQSTTHPNRMVLRTQQRFAGPPESIFDFFADAANLEAITPPWLHFRILTPLPVVMDSGTLIDYQLRLHWIPIHWRTKIAEWDPPHRFVDQQLQGPYRLWRHTHTFEPTPDGTLMTDTVEYSVPGGRLINRWFVEPDLNKIFAYRQQSLAKRLASSTPATA